LTPFATLLDALHDHNHVASMDGAQPQDHPHRKGCWEMMHQNDWGLSLREWGQLLQLMHGHTISCQTAGFCFEWEYRLALRCAES
jgi:hypothetical protein